MDVYFIEEDKYRSRRAEVRQTGKGKRFTSKNMYFHIDKKYFRTFDVILVDFQICAKKNASDFHYLQALSSILRFYIYYIVNQEVYVCS